NGNLTETWLNIPLILSIAKESGADAIHPGYGFLSENAAFARACEQEGIIFIGPRSDVIEKMGSKILSSAIARQAGIPLLPRLEGEPALLIEKAHQLGFPLLVKAAAGGGGKGMVRIDSQGMLEQGVFAASEQALRYFANEKVYLEKYVQHPRHIEVQILADNHGNVVHLLERECTLQRNHQKVVEEAPSVSLNPQNRTALHDAAVKLAKTVGYTNAGTVEFILDEDGKFYFLEMNTRIQVEHPVTEAITGVDIVEEQLHIAMNKKLSVRQEDVKAHGHAIEVRLYAEDPLHNFRPSAGTVKKFILPTSKDLRVDSSIASSGKVNSNFDAMIAKIVVSSTSRDEAIMSMQKVLDNTLVHGIKTNLALLAGIVKAEIYKNNTISTHSIADNLSRWATPESTFEDMILAAGLFLWLERYSSGQGNNAWRMANIEKLLVNQNEISVFHFPLGDHGVHLRKGDQSWDFSRISVDEHKISFLCNKKAFSFVFSYSERNSMFLVNGVHYQVVLPQAVVTRRLSTGTNGNKLPDLKATLFGRVLRVNVAAKQKVKSGDPLLVVESMKMENTILAPEDNVVSSINVKVGDQVSDGQVLISFED
ncbi:MAG: acetyl/propionyl/methylcrotonyl-CoA carboxylase subunit alpha, partial [Bacteroidota bacterium]